MTTLCDRCGENIALVCIDQYWESIGEVHFNLCNDCDAERESVLEQEGTTSEFDKEIDHQVVRHEALIKAIQKE